MMCSRLAKSVSVTALVGGDDRVREAHRESVRVALSELERYTQARIGKVREAHRESVRVALSELERYTQARIGKVREPETTGKFAAATFEHDTARPVDGYAAPQLHTHAKKKKPTKKRK